MASQTTTIPATVGTFMRSTGGATQGAATTFAVGVTLGIPDVIDRGLLTFALSGVLPPGLIKSATLNLRCTTESGLASAAAVRRVDNATALTDMVENEIDWTNYKAATAWTAAGGDYTDTAEVTFTLPVATGAVTITGLDALVDDAVDNRSGVLALILMRTTEGGTNGQATYASDDHGTEAWRPTLDVVVDLQGYKAMKGVGQ